jgi:aspartyl/asparaginyl beta-hydroxylase
MMFASLVGSLTPGEMTRLQSLARNAPWRDIPARRYDTADITDFWEPCVRAFFIRIPPKGFIHRHSDEAIKGITHHLVLQTNPKSLNWWLEDGQDCCVHLEAGKRYIVQRDPVHWATNEGDTDRIHLLVEYG